MNIVYQVKSFLGRSVDKNRQIDILLTVAFITTNEVGSILW